MHTIMFLGLFVLEDQGMSFAHSRKGSRLFLSEQKEDGNEEREDVIQS